MVGALESWVRHKENIILTSAFLEKYDNCK